MANAKNTAIGFILGAAAGAITGLLLAPDSGKNTRVKLKQSALDLKDTLNTTVEDGYSKINKLKEDAVAAVNKTMKKGEATVKETANEASNIDINS